MARICRFTGPSAKPVFINPLQVSWFFTVGRGTRIVLAEKVMVDVTATVEDVEQAINDGLAS